MKTIIQFNIRREDGIYTADAIDVPIVTEAGTFEDLRDNIRGGLSLCFR